MRSAPRSAQRLHEIAAPGGHYLLGVLYLLVEGHEAADDLRHRAAHRGLDVARDPNELEHLLGRNPQLLHHLRRPPPNQR